MKKTISALFVVCLLLLMVSCKGKTVFVPVESVKTEWRDKYTRDSIYIKDSVRIYQRGDTIFQDRFEKIYKDKHIKDSIYINDTIRVPVLVPSEPVYLNKLHWWQESLIWVGVISLLLIIGVVAYKIKF